MIEARFHINWDDFNLNVDLSIPDQGVTGLIGASGCGKTTLLRAIAGLEHHRGGFLKVGKMIWQDGKLFLPPHQRPLGYVFQEPSLFAHLSVKGNLEYGFKRIPLSERKVSLEKAISLLGIKHLLNRKPSKLSGGERQRVAIARALAVSPGLLLMDEPLASLDLASKKEILPYIESLHSELDIPVIYVSHAPDEVAQLAGYLVLMKAGSVVASGPIREMLTRLDLPLSHKSDAAALIEATVARHDAVYHLTYLNSGAGQFTVVRKEVPIGSSVRLQVAARDVSLTLKPPSETSIRNAFPAIVEEVTPEGKAQMTVRLKVGDIHLLSRITRKSADELGLKPGKSVYAQVKSVALLR